MERWKSFVELKIFTIQYDTREASAAPTIPKSGINTTFNTTLNMAPNRLENIKNFVFPITTRLAPFKPRKICNIKPNDKILSAEENSKLLQETK